MVGGDRLSRPFLDRVSRRRSNRLAAKTTEVRGDRVCIGVAVLQNVPDSSLLGCGEGRAGIYCGQHEAHQRVALQQHQRSASRDSVAHGFAQPLLGLTFALVHLACMRVIVQNGTSSSGAAAQSIHFLHWIATRSQRGVDMPTPRPTIFPQRKGGYRTENEKMRQ